MSVQSERARVLRESKLIIWDEITMADGRALVVVDRLLRDLMGGTDATLSAIQVTFGSFGFHSRHIIPKFLIPHQLGLEASAMISWEF